MAFCSECGERIPADGNFCATCGARVNEDDLASTSPTGRDKATETRVMQVDNSGSTSDMVTELADDVRQNTARYVAGGIFLIILIFAFVTGEPGVVLLVTLPMIAGLLFPIMSNDGLTSRSAALGAVLSRRGEIADASDGKFARYARRPMWKTVYAAWHAGESIKQPHVRTGVQVASVTYLLAIFGAAIAFTVVFLVYLALALLLLAFIGWLINLFMGGGHVASAKGAYRIAKRTGLIDKGTATLRNNLGEKIGTVRASKDWFGTNQVERRATDGTLQSVSREEEGVFGSKTVTRDVHGDVLSTSTFQEEILGNGRIVHRDPQGNVTGYSRIKEGIFGEITEHFNAQGQKTGETRRDS